MQEASTDQSISFNERVYVQQDELCKKCATSPEMLCSGYRWERGTFGRVPCERLNEQLYEIRQQAVLRQSSIPFSYIETWDGEFTPLDEFTVLPPTNDGRLLAWNYGIAQMQSGRTFKYVPVQLLLRDGENWSRMLETLGTKFDIVFFDRFDLGTAPDMAIDLLCETVWFRYNAGLSTLVTVDTLHPRIRATSELKVYDLFESWKQH